MKQYDEKFWHELEKDWVFEMDDKHNGGQVKRLRRMWWHISDDVGLVAVMIAVLLAVSLLVFGIDFVFGFFR